MYPVILTSTRTSHPMHRDDSLPLILASSSKTRLALLLAAGLQVTARAALVDEDEIKRVARAAEAEPEAAASMLALAKARYGALENHLVIGADQLLTCEDRWFDKPVDLAAARQHLLALRGRSHILHCAVCVTLGETIVWQHIAQPRLTMRHFSDAFLDAYLELEGEQLLSSVGAYRLEGPGIQLFEQIDGEHAAILGLPMLAMLEFFRSQNILIK